MSNIKKFDIQIEEPWTWEGLEAPEDLLGELTDFQLGLKRFCFECNHKVLIKLGEEKETIFFDPDIISVLEDNLPQQISDLSCGQKIRIDFDESSMYIDFTPDGSKINCMLKEFGTEVKYKSFELEKSQVLGVFKGFLNEVIKMAVDGSYIRREEADEFFQPCQDV